jgi:hypothetical protein
MRFGLNDKTPLILAVIASIAFAGVGRRLGTASDDTELLAAISESELAICGFVSRRLDVYDVGGSDRARRAPSPLARDCGIGVIRLADTMLAYADETTIRFVTPA